MNSANCSAVDPTRHRYFCTLFDSGYLFKGAVMISSLKKHCPDSIVFVLCLDTLVAEILVDLNIEGCVCIALAQVENDALLAAKANRNVAEYCWTLSSFFTAWLMENRPEVDLLTYVDADMMFYSSPEPLYAEMREASIGIVEHRFIPRLAHLESKGRFCVEWVSFRRDDQGLACLFKWRAQCLEWCYDRLEAGRMGDQKYLDAWPSDYSRTRVLAHAGSGVAPWNYANYRYIRTSQGQIMVDDVPLIFYHFHQFQLIDDGSFYRLSPYYAKEAPPCELIYATYEMAVADMVRTIQYRHPGFTRGMKSRGKVMSRRWIQAYVPRAVKEFLKRFLKY